MTTWETTGEVVVATARCTRVATSTEFKPELNKSPFTKIQLFQLQRADPASTSHQPIKIYPLNIIPTRFSESRFDKISQLLILLILKKLFLSQLVFIVCKPYLWLYFQKGRQTMTCISITAISKVLQERLSFIKDNYCSSKRFCDQA
jgi:hypothetical protein